MSESTWYNGIEVYTHNGMSKCWTCGQRLASWEEPEELAEWMAEHAHDDSEDETTCPHCDMETSQTDLTAGECLAEHRRG